MKYQPLIMAMVLALGVTQTSARADDTTKNEARAEIGAYMKTQSFEYKEKWSGILEALLKAGIEPGQSAKYVRNALDQGVPVGEFQQKVEEIMLRADGNEAEMKAYLSGFQNKFEQQRANQMIQARRAGDDNMNNGTGMGDGMGANTGMGDGMGANTGMGNGIGDGQ